MSRNLHAKVTLLGLELEDMLFLAMACAIAMLVGQFLFPNRYMFFLPMNWFLMLMVLVLGVPGLVVFKYGKPRGYLLDLVTYYGLPRSYCGCARDRKLTRDFLIDPNETEIGLMPRTRAQHERSLEDPAVCELLKIRDFLNNVMVRTDGCYVAGFGVAGSMTYFGDDEERNESKSVLESLLRAMPEQSMRLQFRYEVVESLNGLLDQYRQEMRCENAEVQALDEQRMAIWTEKEREGAYLTRIAAVYLIWDPAKHKRALLAGGAPMSKEDRRLAHGGFTLSINKSIEKSRKEHEDTLAEFESLIAGIESAMKAGGLRPERMTEVDLFLEVKRAMRPMDPDRKPLKAHAAETRYISPRERATTVSILGQTESYINIDGLLWSFISLNAPPDGTYPGILRQLMTIGFPVVISTHVSIPDQRVVLDKYKKKLRKMQAAQKDSKGNLRVDVTAQVASHELIQIQQELIANSVKTARVSMVIGIRTSAPAWSADQYEKAERELANRRQQVLHIVAHMNGARGLSESLAARRIFL